MIRLGCQAKRIDIAFRPASRMARCVADSGSLCARFLRCVPDRSSSATGREAFGDHDQTAAVQLRGLRLPFAANRATPPRRSFRPLLSSVPSPRPGSGQGGYREGKPLATMTERQHSGRTIGIAFRSANRIARCVADSGSFCARFFRPRPASGQGASDPATIWQPDLTADNVRNNAVPPDR
jgi:hypothetical protein